MIAVESSVNPAVATLSEIFEFDRILLEESVGLAFTVTLLKDVTDLFVVSYHTTHHTTECEDHAREMVKNIKKMLTLH